MYFDGDPLIPPKWLGLLLVLVVGGSLIYLGLFQKLPRYRSLQQYDHTNPISYVSSVIIGIAIIVAGIAQYFEHRELYEPIVLITGILIVISTIFLFLQKNL